MAKNLEVSFLLDFYGEMLTQKQHDFLVYYYDEDLSLSEIAENEGITRQGVRDAIKRAENQLFEMESRLGLAKKFETLKKGLEEIEQCAEAINAYRSVAHTVPGDQRQCGPDQDPNRLSLRMIKRTEV